MKNLFILPFDHRSSFLKIYSGNPKRKKDVEKAKRYKKIIYQAFVKATKRYKNKKEYGILIDEQYGKSIIKKAQKDGYVTSVCFEKSGKKKFELEYKNIEQKINDIKPTFIKLLIQNTQITTQALKQIQKVQEKTKKQRKKLLIEIVVKKGKKHQGTIEAMEKIVKNKIKPHIWKLEGTPSQREMKDLSETCQTLTPQAKIIILGGGDTEKHIIQILQKTKKYPNIIGFAIGRTIFKEAIKELSENKITEKQTTEKISKKFKYFITKWKN